MNRLAETLLKSEDGEREYKKWVSLTSSLLRGDQCFEVDPIVMARVQILVNVIVVTVTGNLYSSAAAALGLIDEEPKQMEGTIYFYDNGTAKLV